MKSTYGLYLYNSGSQIVQTRDNLAYILNGTVIEKKLIKLHTPFPERLTHSWYYVIEDEVVIDCYGYIEDRCLIEIKKW